MEVLRKMWWEKKMGGKEQVRQGVGRGTRERAGTEGCIAGRKVSNSASITFFCQGIFVAWAAHEA